MILWGFLTRLIELNVRKNILIHAMLLTPFLCLGPATTKSCALPNQPQLSLDKTVLTDMMAKEYERLGKPLSKDGETLMSIIKRVEIELSRNMTFTIMQLSCLINIYNWFELDLNQITQIIC